MAISLRSMPKAWKPFDAASHGGAAFVDPVEPDEHREPRDRPGQPDDRRAMDPRPLEPTCIRLEGGTRHEVERREAEVPAETRAELLHE
jgi:hypothetical protein